MKRLTIRAIRKSSVLLFGLAILMLAYDDFLKQQRMEADERQRFVDEVNSSEEQLNEKLVPLIEENRRLNQQSVSNN